MSLDFNKMRNKLKTLRGQGGGKQSAFWKPQDGEQTVRIVPTPDGDPFKEYFFHYNVGKATGFLCPKRNFGDTCPVCDFATQLWNEDAVESKKLAKSLFARQRFFSPIVVRNEENAGVRVWGYGKTTYETLLNLVLNPDYGDITDVDEGTDFLLHYGKPQGASFPQTKIQPRRNTSPLVDNADVAAELLNGIPDYDELFERKTSEEVGEVLDQFLLTTDEEAGSGNSKDGVVKFKAEPSGEAKEVEAAFNELLGQ